MRREGGGGNSIINDDFCRGLCSSLRVSIRTSQLDGIVLDGAKGKLCRRTLKTNGPQPLGK